MILDSSNAGHYMFSLTDILPLAPDDVWEKATILGQEALGDWIHEKWYDTSQEEYNGLKPTRISDKDFEETPFKRKLFWPSSSGRFGLDKIPVAYFGSDIRTAMCETIPDLRYNNDLTDDIVDSFLIEDPLGRLPGFGVPRSVYLCPEIRLLDLAKRNNALFGFLEDEGISGGIEAFVNGVIHGRSESAAMKTHPIAQYAFDHGLDGIRYCSVRYPRTSTYVNAGTNVVLFQRGERELLRLPGDP